MSAILPGATIGILGGGQLGRMTAMAARSLGYRVQVMDPDPSCPARFVVDACFEGSWDDAKAAADGAKAEGFAPNTVIFLDIEDGGRLPPAFHTYLRAWADELSRAGYRPGVYCSGIPNKTDENVRTADDIKEHMHGRELVYWIYNDVCPPAPGCVTAKVPRVARGGVSYAAIFQYVQSPRRKEYTAQCAETYNADGNCYAPGDTAHSWFLDLNSANSADPSSAE